jgi:hypothetical protein
MEFLMDRGRLESFTADDLGSVAEALLRRATLRVGTSARAALDGGDVDGAFVLAYDGYRLAAESLLARQGLRATGGDGSHMTVEDAISAQFSKDIPAFAKATFERLRRTRHSAQYLDLTAAPITEQDASWAIEKATAALEGVRALLASSPPSRFVAG